MLTGEDVRVRGQKRRMREEMTLTLTLTLTLTITFRGLRLCIDYTGFHVVRDLARGIIRHHMSGM